MGKQVLVASPRSGLAIDEVAYRVVADYQPEMLTEPQPFEVQRFLECELEDRTQISYDYQELQPNVHGYTDIERMECVICSLLFACSRIP